MKRILVGIGSGDDSRAATTFAIELAKRFDALVTAIGIVDLARINWVGPVPLGAGAAAKALRQERYERATAEVFDCMQEFSRECTEASVRFGLDHESGDALPELIKAARYHDLLICGLGGMFEHGVVEEPRDELRLIIESGVHPLLAVPTTYREVKQILIAYSGSIESAKTMKHFAAMRLWPDAKLKLVHFELRQHDGDQLLKDAQDYLAAHDLHAETELVSADPRTGLLPFAECSGADLLVVGNSAKSLLSRRVFGETALTAMCSSSLPLFLGQ